MRALFCTILFSVLMCRLASGVSSSSAPDPALQAGECVLIQFVDHSAPDIYERKGNDGHIVLPMIGQIRVADLSTRQATGAIMKAYQTVGHPAKLSVARC